MEIVWELSGRRTMPDPATITRTGRHNEITVRGVKLPPGMTRDCLNELAGLFNERADELCDLTNDEFAVMAFRVVLSHCP